MNASSAQERRWRGRRRLQNVNQHPADLVSSSLTAVRIVWTSLAILFCVRSVIFSPGQFDKALVTSLAWPSRRNRSADASGWSAAVSFGFGRALR